MQSPRVLLKRSRAGLSRLRSRVPLDWLEDQQEDDDLSEEPVLLPSTESQLEDRSVGGGPRSPMMQGSLGREAQEDVLESIKHQSMFALLRRHLAMASQG